jgi:murein L,D-transpeptidase YafK
VKQRKWARFLGLSLACLASLCLGAFLSYQAAMQEESSQAPASDAATETSPSANVASSEPQAAIQGGQSEPAPAEAAAPAPVPARPMILASLESDAPPFFSPSNAQAAPLNLRVGDDSAIVEAALHDSDIMTPANPEPIPAAPEPSAPEALFHGKPAPLPPVRPSYLNAAVMPPAEAAPAASASTLPEPPPVPGADPRPTVAAAPQTPAVKSAPPAVTVAAATSQGSFPGIANARAAVSASVGGANAAVTPIQPAAPGAPNSVAEAGGFKKGQQVYVRTFKKEGVLELWLKRADNNYALYKSYPVCKWSGQLGPKTRQSDYQSPEGFYSVSARQLNPNSHYHLAFDLGYPNAYDRRQGSTGSAVMVHGDCKSVGCFAMTNDGIDEIYGIVEAALRNGQHEVPVHIFPFRMTDEAIVRESSPKQFMAFLATANEPPRRDWSAFWRNLKEGYDMFERGHVPPVAFACGDRYEFGAAAGSCARIAGW